MAKRLVNTGRWTEAWYIDASPLARAVWDYMWDNCNIAGIIDIPYRLLNFIMESKEIDSAFVDDNFGDKVHWLDSNKLIIKRFIRFHHKDGDLNENYNPHKAVIKELIKNNLTLEQVLNEAYVETEKIIKKPEPVLPPVAIEETPKPKKTNKPPKHKYGDYQNVLLADVEYDKLLAKLGAVSLKKWIVTMDEGVEMKGYSYKSHYLAILKWIKNETKSQTPVTKQTSLSLDLQNQDYPDMVESLARMK